jgi:hypothetical protein
VKDFLSDAPQKFSTEEALAARVFLHLIPPHQIPPSVPAERTDIGQQGAKYRQDGRRDAPHKLEASPLDA